MLGGHLPTQLCWSLDPEEVGETVTLPSPSSAPSGSPRPPGNGGGLANVDYAATLTGL